MQWICCKKWSHAQSQAAQTSADLLLWACQSQREWTADRLASTADITSALQLGRTQVPRSLRSFLNMDRPNYHSTDRLMERRTEKGSGRHSNLQGQEQSWVQPDEHFTVLRATLGRLLRGGAERICVFLSPTMPSRTETETETETTGQQWWWRIEAVHTEDFLCTHKSKHNGCSSLPSYKGIEERHLSCSQWYWVYGFLMSISNNLPESNLI